MASSSHVQKKLKTLHEFFVKSLEKADFPNAQTILKAAAEKHPMLSSMLLEADKIEIIDVLLKESYAQAISQAKDEMIDIFREHNIEEVLVRMEELSQLAKEELPIENVAELSHERRLVMEKELKLREAELRAVEKEIDQLKEKVLSSQKRRRDFVESTRSFIEKVGQPVIAEEFQEAIDFAEELTAKQMIPDGVRRKRK